jgi:hypothetical protein
MINRYTGGLERRKYINWRGVTRFIVCVMAWMTLGVAHADNEKYEALMRNYGVTNVATPLLSLYDAAQKRGTTLSQENVLKRDVTSGRLLRRFKADDSGGVLLDLRVNKVSHELLASLEAAGVRVKAAYRAYSRVTVATDNAPTILNVAAVKGVRAVMPVYRPRVWAGSVTSRAVTALRTESASSMHGVDGTGTMIGILSDSFARTDGVRDGDTLPAEGVPGNLTGSTPQDSGDLPATVNLLSDSLDDGHDEGAGMAELVHDIAPGAAIAFHDMGNTEAEMASAIGDLCALDDMSVVVDDVGFFAEAYYQDDLIAQAATACISDAGIPYFSAFGNGGDLGYRQTFRDIDPETDDTAFPITGGDLHDWDPGAGTDGFLAVTLPPGGQLIAILQWNQPNDSISSGNGSQIDMDLYVSADGTIGNIIDGSNTQQGDTGAPGGDAVEVVMITNDTAGNLTRYLAIDHYKGEQKFIPQDATKHTPVEFRLVLVELVRGSIGALEYPGDGPTGFGHPYGAGVVGVAAVPWWETEAFDPSLPPTANTDPEPFTSRGGDIPVQFDAGGNFMNVSRTAPVLSSVDGNNTTFFGQNGVAPAVFGEDDGFPNFFGTSAAAPNAAAVALLMLELNSTLTPAAVTTLLTDHAVDVTGNRAAAGEDDVTGAGLIDAVATLDADTTNVRPTADAGADQDVNGNDTVTLDGSGSSDPEGAIAAYLWEQTDGTSVTLSDSTISGPTFTAPNENGRLNFRLTVTDAGGLTDTDTVVVTTHQVAVSDTGGGGSSSSDGGCTLGKPGAVDPLFWLMILASIVWMRKHQRVRTDV